MRLAGSGGSDRGQFLTSIRVKEGSDDDDDDDHSNTAHVQATKRVAMDVARWKEARCDDGTRPLEPLPTLPRSPVQRVPAICARERYSLRVEQAHNVITCDTFTDHDQTCVDDNCGGQR